MQLAPMKVNSRPQLKKTFLLLLTAPAHNYNRSFSSFAKECKGIFLTIELHDVLSNDLCLLI